MPDTTTVIDALIRDLLAAGAYNRNDQIAPAAVLWTDKERQWKALLPRLRDQLTLLTLGDYDPDTRTGPAYYLRCLLAGTLGDPFPDDTPPILYLPGYSRQDLRAVEECPKALQPLAELQYRGVLWTQINAKDWTIASFLQNKDHGLGIAVAGDQATRQAMQRALVALADEPVAALQAAAPLSASFFDALLTPDVVQHLLRWLDDPEQVARQVDPEIWGAFCGQCQTVYDFDPNETDPSAIASRLTEASGPWVGVWRRYKEAPKRYPNLPALLEQLGPTQLTLFQEARAPYYPQANKGSEDDLRQALMALENGLPRQVRAQLYELDQAHGERRAWVWAALGEAPLAVAVGHLAALADATEHPIGGASVEAVLTAYLTEGWQADQAMLDALGVVSAATDVAAVCAALLPIYRTWLRNGAAALQRAIVDQPDAYRVSAPPSVESGACLLFCDALRYDVGQRLQERLQESGFDSELTWRLAALPTVTPTAKPAVSPVADLIVGDKPSLTPVDKQQGRALRIERFRRLLDEMGIQDLPSLGHLGDPSGMAWDEQGTVDRYGHQHGIFLAHHVHAEIERLVERVDALLAHGWQQVTIVTDHGWLLLPGGLPKADLSTNLTLERKGRCAVLSPNAQTEHQTVPWHWNADIRIAIAPDIHCFEAGKTYEHGGISPQECVLPVLRVQR